MTTLEHNILLILRCFGPCSVDEVARRVGQYPYRTAKHLWMLRDAGLVIDPGFDDWDLSYDGFALVDGKILKREQLCQQSAGSIPSKT